VVKKLLVGLGVCAVLLAAVLGYAIVNANRLVERFRPDLERLASDAVGSPVGLGALDVSILPAAHITLDRLTVGGDGGLTLRNLALRLRLLPLLAGRLQLVALTLVEPRLVFVKDARGITLEGLPAPGAPPGKPGGDATSSPPVPPALALDLERLEIRGGAFTLKDTVAKHTYALADVSVDAALALDRAGIRVPRLRIAGTLADAGPITVTGKDLALDQTTGVATVGGLTLDLAGTPLDVVGTFDTRAGRGEFRITSAGIDLARLAPLLEQVAPAVKPLAPRGVVTPDLQLRLAPGEQAQVAGTIALADVGLDTGAGPIRKLRGRLDLHATPEATTVASRDLALELAGKPIGVTLAAGLAGDVATVKELVVSAFGGTTTLHGAFRLASQRFDLNVTAERLDLAQLDEALSPGKPRLLLGTVSRFQSTVAGSASGDVGRALTGTGALALTDGRLVGVNLVGDVVKKLAGLPGIAASVRGAIPDDLRGTVDGQDTRIDSLRTDFGLGDAAFHLTGLNAVSPGFTLDGGGRVGFDASVDLAATILLAPSLAHALTANAKLLRAALDDQGRLPIPLTMRGTPPHVAVVPDVSRLAGSAGKVLADELLKELDKGGKGLGRLLHGF
jgi:hypothetical protein